MMSMHRHVSVSTRDSRQAVSFPPMMREHTLANMRDHLDALSAILTAMAASNYTEAAHIADARLSMDSSAAAGCKALGDPNGGARAASPMDMESMMAQFMPEGMRVIGLGMHQSASAFAAEATKAAKSGDARTAYEALARVTQQCTACHAAYRLQ